MIDNYNVRISVNGEGPLPNGLPDGITMAQAIKYIKSRGYEDDLAKRLISVISRSPSNTMRKVLKNLDTIISRIREEIKNERKAVEEGSNKELEAVQGIQEACGVEGQEGKGSAGQSGPFDRLPDEAHEVRCESGSDEDQGD